MLRNSGTLVLLLLLATPLAAFAQNTGKLSGRVTDDLGDPLPGANVVLGDTQLGAATDIDGNYFIIGIPVGDYDVTASFVGSQSQTVDAVQISSGYTTEQNFELGPESLGTIEITYERPIIQKDAIGVPKVVSGEQIENLPIRGVANVAAIQSGVVNNGTSDDLFIRGGRNEEVAYYVDGVKIAANALLGVNQQAIQEQEILIGTIPAKYGDVQSGVISITTKSGGNNFFGSLELITSEVLDSYGYNVGSLSIGGPIISNRASFFLSGQGSFIDDVNPYGGNELLSLSDEAYSNLLANPQVIQLQNDDGDFMYLPFPFETVRDGIEAGGTFTEQDLIESIQGDVPDGFSVVSGTPVPAPDTFTRDQFESSSAKDNPLEELTFNGNATFNITPELSLRVGGGYETRDREEFSFTRSLYNRDRFYHDERDSYRLYGTFRQRLADNAFYQIQGEFQDWKFVQYPNGFSDQVEDAFFYGDLERDYLSTLRNSFALRDGRYAPLYTQDGFATGGAAVGVTFSLPGSPIARFQKAHDTSLRFSGSATTQLGLHQVEFGAEFQQETRRFYSISGFGLSRYYADDDPEIGDGVTRYSDLPFNALRERTFYYGYNAYGTEEVDDENVDAYFNVVNDQTGERENTNVAPYEPIYYAGYIQDKIEYRDLVINLGLRVDVFDNNTLRLFDVYAPRPIVRAGDDIDGVPGNIGSDYAVYFNDNDNIVGYRDLDGNFFDAQGASIRENEITGPLSGSTRDEEDAPRSAAFVDYEPEVTFMPRVGVSFPVTDRALFFASYNVTSQRPTERAFAPFRTYDEIGVQDSRTPNPGLQPEETTQYELGFRQRVGERAAITLSGFYRTQENKISNRRLDGGSPTYGTYLNADFTTTKGVEFEFDLRRTANVAINANYTLAFAQGTGSDAAATATIVWRGNFFPNFISPADFDQRHTLNGTVDYRFGADEGPMIGGVRPFENFGINMLASYGSGTPYTPLIAPQFSVDDSFTSDAVGTINSDYLPATYRLDLKVDRRFDLGFSGAQAKVYVTVLNVLDTENVLAVYRATGLPDEDGYLGVTGGQSALLNSLDPAGYAFNYGAYTSGPVNIGGSQSSGNGLFYGPPRQLRLGVLVNF